MDTTKRINITYWYDRDEYGSYLNARLETPNGVREIYDTTTEEAIIEALKDVNIELDTDYDWGDDEGDYE